MLGIFSATAAGDGEGTGGGGGGGGASGGSSSESTPSSWRRRWKSQPQATTPSPRTQDDLAMVKERVATRRQQQHRRNRSDVTQAAANALRDIANLVAPHHPEEDGLVLREEDEAGEEHSAEHCAQLVHAAGGTQNAQMTDLCAPSVEENFTPNNMAVVPERGGRRARIKRWFAKVRDEPHHFPGASSRSSSTGGTRSPSPSRRPTASKCDAPCAYPVEHKPKASTTSPVLSTASHGALLANVGAQKRRKGGHRRSRSALVGSREAENYFIECLSWDRAKQLQGPDIEVPPLPQPPPLPAKHSSSRSAPGERAAPPPLPPFPPHVLSPCKDMQCLNARVSENERRRPSM